VALFDAHNHALVQKMATFIRHAMRHEREAIGAA
jgi:hypothetical protein